MISVPRRAGGSVWVLVLVCSLSAPMAPAMPQQVVSGELTVTGTVREPGTREPVPGERVELAGPRAAIPSPGTRPVQPPSRETISDQNGRFQFDSLPPGEYTLDVPDAVRTVSDRRRTFELAPGPPPGLDLWSDPRAFVSGQVTDADGVPAEAAVSLVQPVYSRGRWGFFSSGWFGTRTDDDGRYEVAAPPGRYYVQARFLGADAEAPTLYYPDEVDVARAVQVSVGRGTVMPEMNFVRRDDAALRVRFEFPLPDAPPELDDIEALTLSIRRLSSDPLQIETGSGSSHPLERLDRNRYRTAPLQPGEYDLLLRYSRELIEAMPEVEWSRLDPILRRVVVLEDEDIDLGLLSPDARASITGRILVEGEEAAGFDIESLPEFRFNRWRSGGGMTFLPEPAADGRFTIDSVFPEQYRFSYNPLRPLRNWLPDGWYVRAITSGGQDVLKDGLTVPAGANLPLDIHVSSGSAHVSGVVRLASDEPGSGALVLLIPPEVRWGPATGIRSALAGPQGRYEINDVPPGDYRVLALDLAGLGTTILFWEEPGFLREYAFRGEAATIEPGEQLTMDLGAVPLEN